MRFFLPPLYLIGTCPDSLWQNVFKRELTVVTSWSQTIYWGCPMEREKFTACISRQQKVRDAYKQKDVNSTYTNTWIIKSLPNSLLSYTEKKCPEFIRNSEKNRETFVEFRINSGHIFWISNKFWIQFLNSE